MLYLFLAALIGYLLGSIPAGYLVGRAHGIDVREHGSGNIGATNVVRVLGKKPGYFVFICDALKGWLAVWLGGFVVARLVVSNMRQAVAANGLDLASASAGTGELNLLLPLAGIVAALACILGHNFPVWLRFRGGKGVATTIGTLLGLMPLAFLIVAAVWTLTFYLTRYVSVASIAAATALPVTVFILDHWHPAHAGLWPMLCFSVVAAALVWWRHRGNIQRLRAGTEPRFARKAEA